MENNKGLQDGYWEKIIKEAEGYLKKVTQDGFELKNVPEDFIDDKICLAAVKQNGITSIFLF